MNPPNGGSDGQSGLKTLEIFSKAKLFNSWLYKNISSYCKGNILEIGSGTGNISRMLLKEGNSVTLSDVNADYCHRLESEFEHVATLQAVYQFDLSDPDFEIKHPQFLNQFDTIVGLNVVEHIRDDRMVIRNARKLLRHKGRIIILVPAYEHLFNAFDQELGHYRRYNRKKLVSLLKLEGFNLVRSKYFNAAGIAGWWFFGSLLNKKIIPSYSLKIFNFLVPFLKIIDLLSLKSVGLSVIAIAENDSQNAEG